MFWPFLPSTARAPGAFPVFGSVTINLIIITRRSLERCLVPSLVPAPKALAPFLDDSHYHPLLLLTAHRSLERCRVPVIAAIHGACVGAGLELVAAADLRFCSTDAVFALKVRGMGGGREPAFSH